ncbi:hypothetical protein [Tengunoibacter tsumagoiensis]|uniref:Uncharacterized protein n=1 Tax=Tengunoibacter tsumagoiensis TaxID=2014871 RepID=A0A402A1V6_9CHLR|nr:hypothetical protein [Tengunoibacter tsumagoiensis]GCE13138.1 hypothetical protein KTT_29970 [Tengunoibacter tsumagoiensis]
MLAFLLWVAGVSLFIVGGVLFNVYLYSRGAMEYLRRHGNDAAHAAETYYMDWVSTSDDMGRPVRRMAAGILGACLMGGCFIVLLIFSLTR